MIKEKFGALASPCCVRTTEYEGDCRRHGIYERSKTFLALLCIPQTPSIMHFPALPAKHSGPSALTHTCTHAHMHTYKGLQQCLTFNYTVCWAVQEQRWVQVDSYLGPGEGCWRYVWELWRECILTKHGSVTSKSLLRDQCLRHLYTRKWESNCTLLTSSLQIV